jgi:hypothetical protein
MITVTCNLVIELYTKSDKYAYTWVSQMKTFNIFYLVIYWTQKVNNYFIFLRSLHCIQKKCSSTSEVKEKKKKKGFWLRAHPLMHRLLHLFIGPERLAPIASLSSPKTWKSLEARMWKTLKGQILDCCNSWMGSMGPSIVMLQQNTCTHKSTSFGLDCRMQTIL